MAITTADRDALVTTLFDTFGEDYIALGRLLAALEKNFPAVAWRARLKAIALSNPRYQASGLSLAWFGNEVARMADGYKGG